MEKIKTPPVRKPSTAEEVVVESDDDFDEDTKILLQRARQAQKILDKQNPNKNQSILESPLKKLIPVQKPSTPREKPKFKFKLDWKSPEVPPTPEDDSSEARDDSSQLELTVCSFYSHFLMGSG